MVLFVLFCKLHSSLWWMPPVFAWVWPWRLQSFVASVMVGSILYGVRVFFTPRWLLLASILVFSLPFRSKGSQNFSVTLNVWMLHLSNVSHEHLESVVNSLHSTSLFEFRDAVLLLLAWWQSRNLLACGRWIRQANDVDYIGILCLSFLCYVLFYMI